MKITLIIILFVFCSALNAKSLINDNTNADRATTAHEFERTFRPYLEARIQSKRAGNRGELLRNANITEFTNRDMFTLARLWDNLTPEFIALYTEATRIPQGLEEHVSPMGKFKIFYSTTGRDAIEPNIDTMGYGGATRTWRTRTSAPNGVPDYIDELAFALDSAWSMIVDRFGFIEPLNEPCPNGTTTHYSVHVTSLSRYSYGATYIGNRVSNTLPGFTSYIEIRNEWTGNEWASSGYNERPQDALRITSTHEFFHSVQLAMFRNFPATRAPDNMTFGWIEGSATLMEEVAFPDVDDYLQYTRAYFSNPRITMLGDNNEYMNVLISKYLYEKTDPVDSIAFVKYVHESNYQNPSITFHANLESASQTYANKSWAQLLNAFHAESFFTGNRARPWAFVSDAPIMRTWSVPAATPLPASDSLQYPSNSARYFFYTPQENHGDTLTISIQGSNDQTFAGVTWAASVLIMENADSTRIEYISINANGTGTFEIVNWKARHGVLAIISNGARTQRWARVQASTSHEDIDTLPINDTIIPANVFPNVVKLRDEKPIRIHGSNITEITILTQDGKLLGRYNQNTPSQMFIRNNEDNVIEWQPNRRIVPGVYYISIASRNPQTNRRDTTRKKIMITP